MVNFSKSSFTKNLEDLVVFEFFVLFVLIWLQIRDVGALDGSTIKRLINDIFFSIFLVLRVSNLVL